MLTVLLLMILILINGIFSATEIAFLSIDKYQLSKEVKKENKKALKIVKLLEDSSSFLSAIQISITLSGFLASAFAAENFAGELANVMNISIITTESLTNVLVIIITIILSYFTLVFGELVPKKIGLSYSTKIAFSMVNIIDLIIVIFKPFILILKYSTDFIIKILKVKKRKVHTEEELKNNIVEASLDEIEKQMLLNVIEFKEVTVEKVMTEREKTVCIKSNSTAEEILNIIKKSKFTRFPVIEDKKVIGILNVKDLVINHGQKFELKDYIRKVIKIKKDMIIDDAFLYLNSKREGIAIVMDDKKFIGIITQEDIIENILGNIFDEYDQEEII